MFPPSCRSSLTSMNLFGVGNNRLSGTLPPELSAWGSSVTGFSVTNNSISGTLPCSYSAWTSIYTIDVSINKLSGTLCEEFKDWGGSIHNFFVNNNLFEGGVSKQYSSWLNVYMFAVGNNKLSGTIHPEYGDWTFLSYAYLNNNNFVGLIPASYVNLTSLYYLDMSFNNFNGDFKDCVAALPSTIQTLVMNNNQISGVFNDSQLPFDLVLLNASSNLLSGSLSFRSIHPSLVKVDLSNNTYKDILLSVEDVTFPSDASTTIALNIRANTFYCPFPSPDEVARVNQGVSAVIIKDSCVPNYSQLVPYAVTLGAIGIAVLLGTLFFFSLFKSCSGGIKRNMTLVIFLLSYVGGVYHHVNIIIVYSRMIAAANITPLDGCGIVNQKPMWYTTMPSPFVPVEVDFYNVTSFAECYTLMLEGWPGKQNPELLQGNLDFFDALCGDFIQVNGIRECRMNSETHVCERVADGSLSRRMNFLSLIEASFSVIIVKEALKVLCCLYICVTQKAPRYFRGIVAMSFLSPLLSFRINYIEDIVLHVPQYSEVFLVLLFDGVLEGMNELALIYYYTGSVNQTGIDSLAVLSMVMNVASMVQKISLAVIRTWRRGSQKQRVGVEMTVKAGRGEIETQNTIAYSPK